jgi:formylglycine-generating enzyme required for sulfatase activity
MTDQQESPPRRYLLNWVAMIGWLSSLIVLGGCDSSSTPEPADALGEFRNSIGIVLVRLPAGAFYMGCDYTSDRSVPNGPMHVVKISQPCCIGKYEVTQAQYQRVMGNNPSYFSQSGDGADLVRGVDTSDFPADHVSWEEAVEFCRRLSSLPKERDAGRVYRLPSEAEWEYACRAGTQGPFAFRRLDTSLANISAPIADDVQPLTRTAAVGSYPANEWGIHDLHGNVWEWCRDGRREYSHAAAVDPLGPNAVASMLRGGAWNYPAEYARSDHRQEALRGYVFFGFRVVCVENSTW